ncbi:hypothetical protein ACTFIW_007166 [Dictyostelium discoideum]
MKTKTIFILLITISLAINSLSSSIEMSVDPNRYSRILIDKDQEMIHYILKIPDERPRLLNFTMNNILSGITFLPIGYDNLLWKNPVTGDFIVGDNSLQPDGHRSATLFNRTTYKLGKKISSGGLSTGNKKYFNVANAGSFAYDPKNNLIFMCSAYEGVFPLTPISMDKVTARIRRTHACEQVRIMNNVFYYTNFALNGSMSYISSCGVDELFNKSSSYRELFYDTTIKDFDVSPTHFYIANSFTNKLYEIPLTGFNISASRREILNFMPDSFVYHKDHIYYSFNGLIKKIYVGP